jgi:hypothetical protein
MGNVQSVDSNFRISPHYRANDWRKLQLDSPDNPDWANAAEILHDRLHGRFLAPVEALTNHPDSEIRSFSGFAILAIDCLLIETLYQFYNGIPETDIKNEDAFWRFFESSPHFQPDFNEEVSRVFYRHVRCGILHQAQTKEGSKVKIGQPRIAEPVDSTDVNKGLLIDRQRFHKALCCEIDDYERGLKNPQTQRDSERRKNLITKMRFIVT